VKSAAWTSRLRSVQGLPFPWTSSQFLDRLEYPSPSRGPDHITSLEKLIGALGRAQGRILPMPVDQQLGGTEDVGVARHLARWPMAAFAAAAMRVEPSTTFSRATGAKAAPRPPATAPRIEPALIASVIR